MQESGGEDIGEERGWVLKVRKRRRIGKREREMGGAKGIRRKKVEKEGDRKGEA